MMTLKEKQQRSKEIISKLDQEERYIALLIMKFCDESWSRSIGGIYSISKTIEDRSRLGEINRVRAFQVVEKMKEIKMLEVDNDDRPLWYPELFPEIKRFRKM